MFHQGFAVKNYIEKTPHQDINKMAAALGVSRQAVYTLFGHEILDLKYVDKLRNAGWKIPGVTDESTISNIANEPDSPVYGFDRDKEMQLLREMVVMQKDVINKLDYNLKTLIERIEIRGIVKG